MKDFSVYQHLPGQPMTSRDIKEAKSKFWGRGKWDNFILPLLPEDCSDMTLIDMGSNAGLFLGYAKEKGFSKVIGIESDKKAVEKGLEHHDYDLRHEYVEEAELPLADYILFVNVHYYINIGDFIPLLDRLRNRTRYCLVVSGNKRTYPHIASSRANDLRKYFKDWNEVKGVDRIDGTGDPSPRKLWTLAFQSPTLKRVSMDKLDCGNHVQEGFYEAIDKGIDYRNTRYFKIIKPYRLKKNRRSLSVWTEEQLHEFFEKKIYIYKSVKNDGLEEPIIINSAGKILDGNHRFMMLKHLGHKTILVREV